MLNAHSSWLRLLFMHSHPVQPPLPWVEVIPPAVLSDPLASFDSSLLDKQPVNFLKGKVARLGVAEIYQRDEGEVETHENQVSLPFQVGQQCRRDHHDEEVP